MSFRERINELFKDGGYTSVVAFADKIGITRQALANYLNGDRQPDYPTLIKICKSLDISADWLLGLSDIRFRDPDYEKMLSNASQTLQEMKKQTLQYIWYMEGAIAELEPV